MDLNALKAEGAQGSHGLGSDEGGHGLGKESVVGVEEKARVFGVEDSCGAAAGSVVDQVFLSHIAFLHACYTWLGLY